MSLFNGLDTPDWAEANYWSGTSYVPEELPSSLSEHFGTCMHITTSLQSDCDDADDYDFSVNSDRGFDVNCYAIGACSEYIAYVPEDLAYVPVQAVNVSHKMQPLWHTKRQAGLNRAPQAPSQNSKANRELTVA